LILKISNAECGRTTKISNAPLKLEGNETVVQNITGQGTEIRKFRGRRNEGMAIQSERGFQFEASTDIISSVIKDSSDDSGNTESSVDFVDLQHVHFDNATSFNASVQFGRTLISGVEEVVLSLGVRPSCEVRYFYLY